MTNDPLVSGRCMRERLKRHAAQLRLRAAEARGEMLVIGHPTRSPSHTVFKAAELDAFVAELEREGDLRVSIATPSRRNK
jgi:RNase H-fold protein (predicted Holliday junction resolvase)